MLAVSFDETVKCMGANVFKLKVHLGHPTPLTSLHSWYCASLLSAMLKGLLVRARATALARTNKTLSRRNILPSAFASRHGLIGAIPEDAPEKKRDDDS